MTIVVCSDCLDSIEFSDSDLGYADGTLAAHFAKIEVNWPGARFFATDAEPVTFSSSTCEGCGTRMAGARYEYAVEDRP